MLGSLVFKYSRYFSLRTKLGNFVAILDVNCPCFFVSSPKLHLVLSILTSTASIKDTICLKIPEMKKN